MLRVLSTAIHRGAASSLTNPMSAAMAKGIAPAALLSARRFASAAPPPPNPEVLEGPVPVTLYQFDMCPFCWRVKAFLDFYQVPYRTVDVNYFSKKEIAFSKDYKKLPIAIMNGVQVNDSENILKHLHASVLPYFQKQGRTEREILEFERPSEHEKVWSEWAFKRFATLLPLNIYGTYKEAYESFAGIEFPGYSSVRTAVTRVAGAAAMNMVMTRKAKKLGITDVRAALFDEVEKWEATLTANSLSESVPSIADLNVYGVMRAVENLKIGRELLERPQMREWFQQMNEIVGESSEVKRKESGILIDNLPSEFRASRVENLHPSV